jgi:hypothetical protein
VNSKKNAADRRTEPRVSCEFYVHSTVDHHPELALVCDLSSQGLCLEGDPLADDHANRLHMFEMQMPGADELIRAWGVQVRQSGTKRAFRLLAWEPEHQPYWQAYLQQMVGNEVNLAKRFRMLLTNLNSKPRKSLGLVSAVVELNDTLAKVC